MLAFSQFEIDLMQSVGFYDTGHVDGTEFMKTGDWTQLNCGCCSSYTQWTLVKTGDESYTVIRWESRVGDKTRREFNGIFAAMGSCV